MFINATQLTQNRAPSDASSVAFQVAIKQQKEFEEALKHSQDRREAEAAAERAQAKAEKEEVQAKAASGIDASASNTDSGSGGSPAEARQRGEARGGSLDVEV